MAQYIFTGTLKLNGVMFFIDAKNEETAKKRAKKNDYDEYDAGMAEAVDSDLDTNTCELNE